MALHALTLTINQRLAVDVERYEAEVDLHVVPPLCPIRTSPADFGHAAELIDGAEGATRAWLASRHRGIGQARLLEPHDHRHWPPLAALSRTGSLRQSTVTLTRAAGEECAGK
jgi:NTE family protein